MLTPKTAAEDTYFEAIVTERLFLLLYILFPSARASTLTDLADLSEIRTVSFPRPKVLRFFSEKHATGLETRAELRTISPFHVALFEGRCILYRAAPRHEIAKIVPRRLRRCAGYVPFEHVDTVYAAKYV